MGPPIGVTGPDSAIVVVVRSCLGIARCLTSTSTVPLWDEERLVFQWPLRALTSACGCVPTRRVPVGAWGPVLFCAENESQAPSSADLSTIKGVSSAESSPQKQTSNADRSPTKGPVGAAPSPKKAATRVGGMSSGGAGAQA